MGEERRREKEGEGASRKKKKVWKVERTSQQNFHKKNTLHKTCATMRVLSSTAYSAQVSLLSLGAIFCVTIE